MTYAEVLKRFRKEFGITQRETAASAGILKESYQKYEYGRDPAISMLCKLADTYNVSLDYLVGRTDNPTRL